MHSNSRSDLHVQKMWQVAVWWPQETPVSQPFPHEPIIRKNVTSLQQCTVYVHHKLSQSENFMMVRLALEIEKGFERCFKRHLFFNNQFVTYR